jgi:hypothetical protein
MYPGRVSITEMFMDCDGSLACVGAQLRSVDWTAGVVLAGCIFWFVFVWVCMGNPYKQVLVSGVWYRQDKVAQLIFDELQALQLRPLPIERIYALEDDVVRLMHQHELLVHGKSWLDGGKRKAKDVPVRAMYDTIVHQ